MVGAPHDVNSPPKNNGWCTFFTVACFCTKCGAQPSPKQETQPESNISVFLLLVGVLYCYGYHSTPGLLKPVFWPQTTCGL